MSIEEDLQFIEDAVKRLRREYDYFFSGAAKLPPFKLRMEADRKALEISRVKLDKLALRFKVQAVMSKYTSCVTLWDKQLKLRESGIRDPRLAAAVSAGRKEIHDLEVGRPAAAPVPAPQPAAPLPGAPIAAAGAPGKAAGAGSADSADVMVSRLRKTTPSMAAVKTEPGAAPAASPKATPPSPKVPPADPSLRNLFAEYNQLRVQAGEKATADLEKFAAMIEKKKAELAQKGSKNVAFGVALKDGRVILKAKTGSN